MISKLSKTSKTLLENFFSLSSLQLINYVIPLINFPYLISVLGIERYGLLILARAVNSYFEVMIDFGFDLAGTKEVSVHRNSLQNLNSTYSSIISIRLLIACCSFILLFALVNLVPGWRDHFWLFILCFGAPFSKAFFSIWFFQGMEKMKYITFLNATSRIIYTIGLFIFVKSELDLNKVVLLNSITEFGASVVSVAIVIFHFKVKFSLKHVRFRYFFEKGLQLFWGNFFVKLYTKTNTIFLSFLTSEVVVGYYSIGEKIIDIFRQFYDAISRTVYPYFALKFSDSSERAYKILFRLIKVLISTSIVVGLALYLFGGFGISLLTETYVEESTRILRILIFIVPVMPLFSLFTAILISINLASKIKWIAGASTVINTILAPIMIYYFGAIGLACVAVLIQYFILSRYVLILRYDYRERKLAWDSKKETASGMFN